MKQNSKVIHEKYEFRNIHKDEIEHAAAEKYLKDLGIDPSGVL